MEGDPFGEFDKDCQISGSQQHILAHDSHFARQDDFPSPFNSGVDWPELSSSSSAASSPSAEVAITICSAPETPETHQADGDATTPQPEEYKTPPEVAAPRSASSDDAGGGGASPVGGDSPDSGFSREGENPKRKREREGSRDSSPSKKKLKHSDDLGFQESTREVQGTVVLVSDDDDEVEEERENVEQARIGGDTEVMNDVGERKEEIEKEKFEVRAEMNEKRTLKVQLNLETNSNSQENGLNLMNCLIAALRNLAGGNQEGGKDEPDDIFETAKQRGMTFPRSRWYDRE
uniref:Uncharacterized protein n=1 Tax=Opuntia streptacantha TaxID=393608 RepID=A0A7C8YWS3_OPUST